MLHYMVLLPFPFFKIKIGMKITGVVKGRESVMPNI